MEILGYLLVVAFVVILAVVALDKQEGDMDDENMGDDV